MKRKYHQSENAKLSHSFASNFFKASITKTHVVLLLHRRRKWDKFVWTKGVPYKGIELQIHNLLLPSKMIEPPVQCSKKWRKYIAPAEGPLQ